MNSILCLHCNTVNPPTGRFCSNCATPLQSLPKPRDPETFARDIWRGLSFKTKASIIGIVAFLFLYGITTINKQSSKSALYELATPSTQSAPSRTTPSSKPPDPAKPSQAPLHLAAAKTALADGYKPSGKDKAWGRVKDARQSLELILPSDKEYTEAQKLIKEVQRRETEIEKWARVTARQLVAEQMERNYLQKGMDVEVRVGGADNRTIKFKYVLIATG